MTRTSFYTYIKRFVDQSAKDPMSRLANQVVADISFPKQASRFDEVSDYMEATGDYGSLMLVFDQAWADYLQFID